MPNITKVTDKIRTLQTTTNMVLVKPTANEAWHELPDLVLVDMTVLDPELQAAITAEPPYDDVNSINIIVDKNPAVLFLRDCDLRLADIELMNVSDFNSEFNDGVDGYAIVAGKVYKASTSPSAFSQCKWVFDGVMISSSAVKLRWDSDLTGEAMCVQIDLTQGS